MNKTQKQIRSASQPSETTIQISSQGLLVGRRGVGESGFDVPVTKLFRVEFGRILRQRLDNDFRMIPEITDGLFTGMNTQVITNQDKTFWHKALEMLQDEDHILTIHRTFEMSFINLARQGQTYGGRQNPAIACDPSKDRSLTPRCPRPPKTFQKGRAEFIKKHYFYAAPPRFFLSGANRVLARRAEALHLVLGRAVKVVANSSLIARASGSYNAHDRPH